MIFQWIPSHVGTDSNKKPDSLSKKRTLEPQDSKSTSTESLKCIFEKLMDTLKSGQEVESRILVNPGPTPKILGNISLETPLKSSGKLQTICRP